MPCRNHPSVNEGLVRCTRCGGQFCRDCVIQLRGFSYCGECKGEQVRDVQSGTPPGTLELATVGRRWGGIIIDNLLLQFAVIPLVFLPAMGIGALGAATEASEEAMGGLMLGLVFLLALGLPIVYEGFMVQAKGQTLGKMAVGIKVVNPDGTDVSAGQAWGRAAVKTALGSCLGLSFLPALFTKDRTCVHDMVAKTRVVRVRR